MPAKNSEQNHSPQPDLLIVLGKNIGIGSSPEDIRARHDHLSRESRINAIAAGELWAPGTDILFSTGQTAGSDTLSEAEAMKSFFKKLYPKVPENYLLTEEKSIDTAGNAEEVAKMIAERRYKRIGLVTVGYHMHGAKTLFNNYGVNIAYTFEAEDAMRTRSRHYDTYAQGWAQSDRVKQEEKKEFVRRVILPIDRKGKLLRLVTTKTRK